LKIGITRRDDRPTMGQGCLGDELFIMLNDAGHLVRWDGKRTDASKDSTPGRRTGPPLMTSSSNLIISAYHVGSAEKEYTHYNILVKTHLKCLVVGNVTPLFERIVQSPSMSGLSDFLSVQRVFVSK
jgi:hypothetical protein